MSGNFSVDVFVFFVEGDYLVIVIVIDSNGNSVFVIDNNGIVDIVVFVILLDVLGLNNDIMLIILGIMDLVIGESVMLLIIDNVGNM